MKCLIPCCLFVLAGASLAPAGEMTPVAAKASDQALRAWGSNFSVAGDNAGTVHPKAVVARLKPDGPVEGGVHVAIDACDAESKKPDCIRLDFSGKGNFADAVQIPLKARQDGAATTATFAKTVNLQVDGRSIPVTIDGQYQKQNHWRYIEVRLGTALQGQCNIGPSTATVRMVDRNANFRCNDLPQVGRNNRNLWVHPADQVDITMGDETHQGYYGQPMLIGKAWYRILVKDGQCVAEQLDAATSHITIEDASNWQIILVQGDRALLLESDGEPLPVPTGEYDLAMYRIVKATRGGRPWILMGGHTGKADGVSLPAGETTTVQTTPLMAKVTANPSGNKVQFGFDCRGPNGLAQQVQGPDSKAPTIVVSDGEKQIYSGRMEYG